MSDPSSRPIWPRFDPSQVARLTAHEAAAALVEVATIQAALVARLQVASPSATRNETAKDGRLLTPVQAAERLGVTVRWLYRHADQLPFTRRLGRKTVRFLESGLERHIRERRS